MLISKVYFQISVDNICLWIYDTTERREKSLPEPPVTKAAADAVRPMWLHMRFRHHAGGMNSPPVR